MLRPATAVLNNARDLEETDGIWGDGCGCTGNTSTLTGDITKLTGCLSPLDGAVHPDLSGNVDKIRGDITNLRGLIPQLSGEYIFTGHGGDVQLLGIIENEVDLILHETVDLPLAEWILNYVIDWFLSHPEKDSEHEGTYSPSTFIGILNKYGLKEYFREMIPSLKLSVPEEVLEALNE